MEKHYWTVGIITAITLATIVATGLVSEASPSQQVTLDVTYSNALTPSFVAQELGLAADRVAAVTVVRPAGGCIVTFNLPLRTDLDQVFDRQGNVVTQNARAVNALDERQQERLDQLMRTQGCFRSRP